MRVGNYIMKVGDLVTYSFQRSRWANGESVDVGLVVETGKFGYANCDVKVLWQGKVKPSTETRQYLTLVETINASR